MTTEMARQNTVEHGDKRRHDTGLPLWRSQVDKCPGQGQSKVAIKKQEKPWAYHGSISGCTRPKTSRTVNRAQRGRANGGRYREEVC